MKTEHQDEKQMLNLIVEHKKNLTVKSGFNTFYCLWTEHQLNCNIEIPFTKAHPFRPDLTLEFLKLPKKKQLRIMKVVFANRIAWWYKEKCSHISYTLYETISYQLANELI